MERNMYGCLPCPACGGRHRYPHKENGHNVIACDDCGRRGEWDGTFNDYGDVNECSHRPSLAERGGGK